MSEDQRPGPRFVGNNGHFECDAGRRFAGNNAHFECDAGPRCVGNNGHFEVRCGAVIAPLFWLNSTTALTQMSDGVAMAGGGGRSQSVKRGMRTSNSEE